MTTVHRPFFNIYFNYFSNQNSLFLRMINQAEYARPGFYGGVQHGLGSELSVLYAEMVSYNQKGSCFYLHFRSGDVRVWY